MKHKNEIKVYLSVYGDIFNPEELTNLLQIQPTYTHIKGQQMRQQSGLHRLPNTPIALYKDTAWRYGSDYIKTFDSTDVSIIVEHAIKDKVPLINQFVKKYNLNVALIIVPWIDKKLKPNISFNTSLLKILSDLNAQIFMDMYIA